MEIPYFLTVLLSVFLNKLPLFGCSFDLVLADPPFLSDECLTKTAVTLKFLAKDKILLCTGK